MKKLTTFLILWSIIVTLSCRHGSKQQATDESLQFMADRESLKQFEVPEWFLDAKWL